MPIPYSGQLNQNKITKVLFNMIISQRVFDSKVANTDLADMFRVDGTLFGDTKLYHSFDIGSPENWGNDAEAGDLLKLNRNKSGKTQAIVMGVYKMISITIDQYLSKQAFAREGTFAEFTSFLTGSLRKIKRVYDRALINSKVGTLSPATDRCDITITSPSGSTIEETNRLEAQAIAQAFDVLKAELEDNNRDFNSLGYLRSYPADEFIAVWNVNISSRITRVDLPTIFHDKDVDYKGGIKQYKLPQKWFGDAGSVNYTLLSTKKARDEANVRILESGWYKVNAAGAMTLVEKPDNPTTTTTINGRTYLVSGTVFLWAGDLVPYTGEQYIDEVRGAAVTVAATSINAGMYYTVNPKIACVLVHKEALPYMSGFEAGTEFWNARSLTSNHYLIFGHNELEFLEEYPRIRITVEVEEP